MSALSSPTPAAVTPLILRSLYRSLLRAAREFPSVNRPSIISTIRTDFRLNRTLVDEKKIQKEISEAREALIHLKQYKSKTDQRTFSLNLSNANR